MPSTFSQPSILRTHMFLAAIHFQDPGHELVSKVPSLGIAGNRAGTLSLINAMFVLASLYKITWSQMLLCFRPLLAWSAMAAVTTRVNPSKSILY